MSCLLFGVGKRGEEAVRIAMLKETFDVRKLGPSLK
jgi:hypothetical protein